MRSAANFFNEFLFDHDLITKQEFFEAPRNLARYNEWQVIYSKLPLDHREYLFKELRQLRHLDLGIFKNLADGYAQAPSSEQLNRGVQDLLQPKAAVVAAQPAVAQAESAPKTTLTRGFFSSRG